MRRECGTLLPALLPRAYHSVSRKSLKNKPWGGASTSLTSPVAAAVATAAWRSISGWITGSRTRAAASISSSGVWKLLVVAMVAARSSGFSAHKGGMPSVAIRLQHS